MCLNFIKIKHTASVTGLQEMIMSTDQYKYRLQNNATTKFKLFNVELYILLGY